MVMVIMNEESEWNPNMHLIQVQFYPIQPSHPFFHSVKMTTFPCSTVVFAIPGGLQMKKDFLVLSVTYSWLVELVCGNG